MALVPQGTPQGAPQTPNFAPQQQAPQAPQDAPAAAMGANGKPTKPVVHGLVNGQSIDDRLSTMPRQAQQMFLQACAQIKELPDIFGTAIGPEAHDYVATVQAAIQQQKQNSAQGAPAPDAQNPQAAPAQGTTGGTPAMATSAAPAPAQ